MTTATMQKCCDTNARPVKPVNATGCYRPAVDIVEDSEAFTILANMPGVTRDNLEIHIEEGELTIHGKVGDRDPAGRSFLAREYGVGDFHASLRINGEAIDAERISAELMDGVLKLHLPKSAAVKPRKIAIQAV